MKKDNKIFSNPILKIITKIISWVLLIFLILIAGILIFNVICTKIYEIKGQKYEPAISLYTIISPSMEPNINVYDVVVTTKVTDFSTIKEGDVITFVSNSSLGDGLTITHRVKTVLATENGIKFRTQGDNNPIPDSSLVNEENVLGKVAFKIPWIGHIQFLLQSKGGWLFALLIPAAIVVIYDIVKVMRLSNIKQKVGETMTEEPRDTVLEEKQKTLKENLMNKYEQEIVVDNTSKTIEKVVATEEVPLVQEQKVEKVENVDIDMNTIMKNIENIEKEQEDINIDKIMSNISRINEEEEDLELPKTK